MEIPETDQLNRVKAVELLESPDTHALTAVMAASSVLDGSLLDDEDETPDESELRMLFEAVSVNPHPDNVTRVVGFLHALADEGFVTSVSKLTRMSSAIVEGDPFYYEESGDDVPLWCVLWALYQVDLLFEDNILDELSDGVKRRLKKMGDEEAVDMDAMLSGEGDDNEVRDELLVLRDILAEQLISLDVPAEWVDQDTDLAAAIGQAT